MSRCRCREAKQLSHAQLCYPYLLGVLEPPPPSLLSLYYSLNPGMPSGITTEPEVLVTNSRSL